MKLTKKIIALILTVAMLSSVSVFAVQFPDVDEKNPNEEAINVLSSLGIIKGYEDGKFLPDKEVTRAELTSLLMRLQNLSLTGVPVEDSGYYDVANTHWAVYDIKTASNMGIIKGFGDGTFGPEAPVTFEQAVKMLVAMLGYESQAIIKGGWPNGYMAQGRELGLLKKAEMTQTDAAPRKIIAQILYNSLAVDLMAKVISSSAEEENYEIKKGHNIMTEYLNIERVEGKVTANYTTRLDSFASTTLEDEIEIEVNNVPRNFKVGEYKDAVNMVGLNVVAFVKYDDNYVYQEIKHIMTKGEVKEVKIAAKDIENFTTSELEIKRGSNLKNISYKIGSNPVMIYNGKYIDWNHAFNNNLAQPDIGSVTIIDSGNGYDLIKVESYKNYVVKNVDTSNNKVYIETSATLEPITFLTVPVKDIFNYQITIKKGTSNLSLSSLKKGNVISVKQSDVSQTGVKIIEILVSDTKKSGKVTGVDEDYYTISSNKYLISPSFKNTTKAAEIVYNYNGTYYIDAFGDIAYTEASAGTTYKYGYYVSSATSLKAGETVGIVKLYDASSKTFKSMQLAEKVIVDGQQKTDHDAVLTLIDVAAGYLAATPKDANYLSAQPIKYTANSSNMITEINTVNNIDDAKFTAGDYVDLAKYNSTNKIFTGTNQSGASVNIKIDSKTVVFYIPANRGSDSEYSIKTSSFFRNTGEYKIEVVEMNSSNIASTLLVYDSNLDSDVHYLSPMFVVTDIRDVFVNEQNKTKLIGYDFQTGNSAEYLVPNKSYIQGIGSGSVDVEKGDLIRFGTDIKGEINNKVYIYLDASKSASGDHPADTIGLNDPTQYPSRKVSLKQNVSRTPLSRYNTTVDLTSLSSKYQTFAYATPLSLTEDLSTLVLTDSHPVKDSISDVSALTNKATLNVPSDLVIFVYDESEPENSRIKVLKGSDAENKTSALLNLKTYDVTSTDFDTVYTYFSYDRLKVMYIVK